MKYLLDTHAFIWNDDVPSQLSPRASAIIRDKNNILLLSHISVWEMQIKLQLGKLTFSMPLYQKIQDQQIQNQFNFFPSCFRIFML